MTAPQYATTGKGGRWYDIPAPPLPEPFRGPSVTTILSQGMPAPALKRWGEGMVAEKAVDSLEVIAKMERPDAVKFLKDAPYTSMRTAGDRGTNIHALAEAIMRGQDIGEWAEMYPVQVDAVRAFISDFNVKPLRVEGTVVQPGTYCYAGSFDWIAEVDGVMTLGDWKSSKGVYAKSALQCAAYARAEWMLTDDGRSHTAVPKIDQVGIVHLTTEGYGWHPSPHAIVDLYDTFLAVHAVAMFEIEGSRGVLPAKPVDPGARAGYRAELVDRVKQLIEWGGADDLVANWPANVPTLKQSDEHTTHQLDAIEYLVRRLEPVHRPPDPTASKERHDDLIGQLIVMPDPILDIVQRYAAHLPNLRTGLATDPELDQLERIITIVEHVPDPDDRAARLGRASKGRTTNPAEVTDDELAAFMRTRSTKKQTTKQGEAAA